MDKEMHHAIDFAVAVTKLKKGRDSNLAMVTLTAAEVDAVLWALNVLRSK